MRSDVGLDWPCDRCDRRARCRAALACIALRVAQVVGVDQVRQPALGPCCERLVGRFRRRAAVSLKGSARLVDRRIFVCTGVGERGLSALQRGLGRHHQPTLGHPVVAQLKTLIAGFLIKTSPALPRQGLGDRLCDRANRVGKARDNAEVSEVGSVVCVVQCRGGDQRPWARGTRKGRQSCLSARLEHLEVRGMAVPPLTPTGDPAVLRDQQF